MRLRPCLTLEQATKNDWRGIDEHRVAIVAHKHGFPAHALVDTLDTWFGHWVRWYRVFTKAQGQLLIATKHRDALRKKAKRIEANGNKEKYYDVLIDLQDADQDVRLHEEDVKVGETREPSLEMRLVSFWDDHKNEWPNPGGGDRPNAFMMFVADCAAALGLHMASEGPTRWRHRWRRLLKPALAKLRDLPGSQGRTEGSRGPGAAGTACPSP